MEYRLEDDKRNILDKFKGMSDEQIKEVLKPTQHNISILIDNKVKNLAAGTLVRTCENFNVKNIIFYGQRDFNRVPSVGTYKRTNIIVAHDLKDLVKTIKNEKIEYVIGLENNIDGPINYLNTYPWNKNIHYLVCIGNEHGLDSDVSKICDEFIEVKSYGAVRSLFLAAAGSIVLYDYCSKMEN